MKFCVQREEAAHLRDRLALRLLRHQHTAATADQLMVITATVSQSISPAYGGNSLGIRNGVMHAPVASQIATNVRNDPLPVSTPTRIR